MDSVRGRMTLSEVIFVWQLFNFPNGFVLGKIIIPEVIFWFGLVKITSGIIILPNTNLFGKLNNYQTKITSDKVILQVSMAASNELCDHNNVVTRVFQ